MKRKVFCSLTAVGVAVFLGGGISGCGTKTIIVQSNTESEINTTMQETAATDNYSGELSKIDSKTPSTTALTTMSATEATTDAASNKDEYFFYDSDKRLLTESDLEGMSLDEMRLARNEIFARRGRKFKERELQDYYNSKSWYKPSIDSDDFNANAHKYLNDIEIKNVEFIKSVEDRNKKDEYFFYDSDKRLLTEADLEGMSVDEMRLARNEIFARRGRKFKEKELQDYYNSKSWYKPIIDSDDFNANAHKYLNDIEIKNAEFIKSVEDKIKAKIKTGDSDKQKVLDAIEGNWRTMGNAGEIKYTFKGDIAENNIGGSFKITDVVRDTAIPGDEGYMIYVDRGYHDITYYYYYDNQPDYLELHWEDNEGHETHGMSGVDSLQRVNPCPA